MPRKPDYKREKKQREEAQRKRNQEAELRKAARKPGNESPAGTPGEGPETP